VTHALGIDIGGTFTDFVALGSDGQVSVFKHLTTPGDPSVGVLDGAKRFAEADGADPVQASRIIHGTTLVANSLIERRGARTALIATRGFRDVLEIGNEARYDLYDLALEKPEPLIPRPLRLEVDERLLADGSTLEPLDEEGARELVRQLVRLGVESVAVCLLHSYANPAHERRLEEILHEEAPAVETTLSSAVAPEWREYERGSTAAANAFVRPLVRRYLARLEQGLSDLGAPNRLHVLMSQGGLTSSSIAAEAPIHLVESGPAGGVVAAAFFGKQLGIEDLISFDMGGTTTKISLVEKGVPLRVSELEVARVARFKRGSGLPLKIASIELTEIGAGGGSLGQADELCLLRIGPRSAGAEPGPACYGRGGTEATVTDADLHLGLLDAAYFLGGTMPLDKALAEEALDTLGSRLGIDADAAARGIFEIVNRQMALALRTHVVERGHDPRRFALVAFGGAGPVHAYEVARHLGIRRIICPPAAGVASAIGFLVSPFSVDLVRTYPGRLDALDWAGVAARFAEMEEQARELLERAGAEVAALEFERRADMRYAGQGSEVPVRLPDGALEPGLAGPLRDAFDRAYERRFGAHLEEADAEALHWRLSARTREAAAQVALSLREEGEALKGERQAYFPQLQEFVTCAVYNRYRLIPGASIVGPALIEERESTIVVGPSATATLDESGHLLVTLT
jgi:N-methylhydantoinase A